jgi:hypothetical protein
MAGTSTQREQKVRFALPRKPVRKEAWNVRRVYGAILLVWVVLVLGVVKLGRDKALERLGGRELVATRDVLEVLSRHDEEVW